MDKVAQANLISLLAALPEADERNLLVAELVGPEAVRPPKEGASPAEHAAQVVNQLVDGRANLEDLFEILNDRHPDLGAQIARTADVVLEPGDDDTDGEGRTEMLMPVTPPTGNRQLGAPRNLGGANLGALAPAADDPPEDEATDGARQWVDPDDKTDPGMVVAAPAPAAAPAAAPAPPPPSFGSSSSESGGGSGRIIALVVVLLLAAGGVALLMSSPPPAAHDAAAE